ncbi:hypothetical protein Tco_0566865 [Tanacetum coccineum]
MEAYSNTMAGLLFVLDEEQLLFIASGQDSTFDNDVDEPLVQDLALNVDQVFQADQCDAFDFDVDEAPTAQTMFMATLSSADPIYDKASLSYDSDILSEVQDHDNYLDTVAEYHEVHEMQNDNNAEHVVQSNVSFVPNDTLMMIINNMHEHAAQCIFADEQNKVVNESLTTELARYKEQVKIYEKRERFSKMHDAYTVEQARKVELEAGISKLKNKIQKDDHNSSGAPEFDSFFEINKMKEQLQGNNNTIRQLKVQISNMNDRRSEADRTLDFKALDSQNIELTEHVTALQEQNECFRAENEKVKEHYKELYDSIKITRAKTIEKTSSLLTKNEKLKAQLKGKMECVTMNTVKPKVLAPSMYAIDVEPILPRNRNIRKVHLDYLKHLKESVETLREIVEEARIERPLDNALKNACFYTKRSQ